MKVSQLVGKPEDIRTHASSADLVDSFTHIGIEIEVEGCNMNWLKGGKSPLSGLWQVVEDGSLRDNGLEFIFSSPTRGDDIVRALKEFIVLAESSDLRISSRTGIHVHLDARGLEWAQLRKLCAVYAMMERIMFNFAGDGREKNIFCLPWYSADATINSLQQIGPLISNESQAINTLQQMHKYSALNLAALIRHGTVEFRHLPTTFNYGRILTWINFILCIKRYALAFEGSTQDLCNQISMQGPAGFLNQVLDERVLQMIEYPDIYSDLFRGMRLAQELQDGWLNQPFYKVLPKEVLSKKGDTDFVKLYTTTHNL